MVIEFLHSDIVLFEKYNVFVPREGDFVRYSGTLFRVSTVVHDYERNVIRVYLND